MSFIVEDGTGLANSTAYVSVSFCDDYHTDRNNTDWTDATTAAKQAAIIKATTYVDIRFGPRFRGYRETKDQALEFPRTWAYDNDGWLLEDIPSQLQKAVSEYARIALSLGSLFAFPTSNSTTVVGEIIEKEETVAPITEKTKYAVSTSTRSPQSSLVPDNLIPAYPEGDMWMTELIQSNNTSTLIRGG